MTGRGPRWQREPDGLRIVRVETVADLTELHRRAEIGRASCRERVLTDV